MRHANPMRAVLRRNLLLMLLLVLTVTLVCMPASAFAGSNMNAGITENGVSGCVTVGSGTNEYDFSTCLPSGRWGGFVGILTTRTEPSGGLLGPLTNAAAYVGTTIRLMLPRMLMMITQVCWSSALAFSQFAASFNPLDTAGAQLDAATSRLISNILAGSIPAVLVVLAIVGWILAAGFEIGTTKEASKRLLATVLCLSALIVMGNGAAKTGEDATEPAAGSPWWVVKTLNNAINTMTVGLNLDGLNDGNENMMAYDNRGNGNDANCQDYLYQMHQQYNDNTTAKGNADSSAVTSAVNRLWEETALRNWVTMQWNNPTAAGSVTDKQAANAQQAYCHVIDLQANTDPTVQKDLTNAAMGSSIDDDTARWIFTHMGWISTYNSLVDDGKQQDDRDDTVRESRAGVFWETCTTNSKGTPKARDGWGKIINNLGDKKTGRISNGGKAVRAARSAYSTDDTFPSDGSKTLLSTSDGDDAARVKATGVVCKVILNSADSNGGVFHRTLDGFDKLNDQSDTNIGDAATLGWRFDIPNLGATWREVNATGLNNPTTDDGAAKSTLDYMYGNASPDTLGAFGSMIGGIVNCIVWGLFSIILIMSKLMLLMMVLFLAVAFLIRAVPIGEKPKKVLGNWVKLTCNLSMTGALYAVIGTIATFICQLALTFCSGMTSTFVYNLIACTSPILAMITIGMFCSKVVKCGNPFSIRAMMDVAGGGALAGGVGKGLSSIGRQMMYARAMFGGGSPFGFGRGSHAAGRRSSRHAGGGVYGATDGQRILDGVSEAQADAPSQSARRTPSNRTTYKDGRKVSPLSEQWSQHGAGTVRGSLAYAARGAERRAGKAGKSFASSMRPGSRKDMNDYIHRYWQMHPNGSADGAVRYASVRDKLSRAGDASLGVVAGANAAVRFAGAAFRSKPLRDVAKRTAKVAAVAGAGALAFSNPITAPLGLMAMGKLAASSDVWHGARVGLNTAGNGAKWALNKSKSGIRKGMADLDSKRRGPEPGFGSAPGSPHADPPDPTAYSPDGQALRDGNPFQTEDKPYTDGMRDEAGNLTADGESAMSYARNGLMDDYMNNQHMTREEAEDALQSDMVSGRLRDLAERRYAMEHEPRNGAADSTPTTPINVMDGTVTEVIDTPTQSDGTSI